MSLNISQFYICVDSTQRFGFINASLNIIGTEQTKCDICGNLYVIYGLCSEPLNYSKEVDGQYLCQYPFEYLENQCICAYGYLLNGTQCINIIDSIVHMQNSVDNNKFQYVEQQIQNIQQMLTILDQSIYDNSSDMLSVVNSNMQQLQSQIISSYSRSDLNLLSNTTELDQRIFKNATDIRGETLIALEIVDKNLFSNTTTLDWRIFNNISSLTNLISDMNISLIQTIGQQQIIIDNLTQQINCTSNYGYKIVNGSCIQIICEIMGQESINGVCQCTNINSIVQNGSCVCPNNSILVGGACVCTTTGQVIQNGICKCYTSGAFVNNGACTCGVYGLNVSNICSCPAGATLIGGICTCTNVNAYISDNQCTCPEFASLVVNTCVCPSNSQIVNNVCTCNKITGQTMTNGVCACITTGAFVVNSACTCGVDSTNTSNICGCPINSSLVLKACVCNLVPGQSMLNGHCQCQTGYSIVINSCQLTTFTIKSADIGFVCSQQLYTTTFDVESVTQQIIGSSNFSTGYVFSSSNNIQNAFIDVADNVYSTIIKPIFQNQQIFTNIKIQFGIQKMTSGSIIQYNIISQLTEFNIISRGKTQITATGQVSMFQQTLNARIQNLLLNVSFALSTGNITLINTISGTLNIIDYQISGIYQSQESISLISLIVNTATTITVTHLNFMPITFKIGNYSSYLFSSISQCSVQLTDIAIIVGNSSKYHELISLSSYNNIYFGGLIANLIETIVKVNQLISSCYQNYETQQVQNSGALIGYAQNNDNNITITNACIQYSFTGTGTQFSYFGIIGYNDGNLSIKQAQISLNGSTTLSNNFGVIGYQSQQQNISEVNDIRATLIINNTAASGTIGTLNGINFAKTKKFIDILVDSTNIFSSNWNGGLAGQLQQTISLLDNVTIQFSIMNSSNSGAGGMIGYAYCTKVQMSNSTLNSINVDSPLYGGIFLGVNWLLTNSFDFTNVKSIGSNYFRDVLQTNCPSYNSYNQC
ncbi:Conserved_hypothetical protein [Hexamita inflata]|uniref:Uncharacterized protein n=1 Tax=Hexamita inflata TaxID=28002 RepID=A0AA86R7F5_9EUKA|nr:Conserved hypothetical protein [Hexamita inflata]